MVLDMSRPKTPRAARLRTMIGQGLAPTEISTATGASLQAVRDADRARKPRGRPPEGLERVTLRISPITAAWLRAESHRDGCTLGDVVEGARLAIVAADRGDDPQLAAARPRKGGAKQ